MLSRARFAVLTALVPVLSIACSPRDTTAPTAAAPSDDSGEVVAVVAGEDVRSGELDTWIREDLFRREVGSKGAAELFEFRMDALQRMVDEKLLDAEAKKAGVSVDELLAQQATGGAGVTDAEVSSFYEENKARMGNATLEQIGPRIRRFLEERQGNESRQKYVQSLRDAAKVTIAMEAPRVQVAADGPARGPANAPVTIVEFSDYQCPFCKRAEPIVNEVMKRYPDQVRLVFRHFPLDQIHPRARPAAEAAACAEEQGKFWEFHEKLFSSDDFEQANLVAHAEGVGLDKAKFEACVNERRFKDKVDADAAAGREAGVSGTPAFFVNGIMMSGAKPVEEFVEIIEREIQAKPKS